MTIFADTEYRGTVRRFAMNEAERLRGVLLLGKAGMGKSQLVAALALQDVAAGLPVFLIDPDGAAIRELAPRIPESRAADVVRLAPRESSDVFDFGAMHSPHPIILADLSHANIKGEAAARFTEQLLEAVYVYALEYDREQEKMSLALFIDSAGRVVRNSFARFLKDAHSLGVAVTLSSRYLGEFSSVIQESLASALATLGLFQLGPRDAEHFARSLHPRLPASLLSSLSPGMLGTNLMTGQGTLPVVVARAVTPLSLGFTPREQSFKSFPSFVRKEHHELHFLKAPEIPAVILEAYLDVGFA